MPRRGRKIGAAFMILWLVFWSAGMLVVLYGLGAALWRGDATAAGFMALWLAAAGFGLRNLRSGISVTP